MSENQQDEILKKAGEMFFKLGIRSVSVDDICCELGMSKKTFYVYFASKDELVAQLLHICIGKMLEQMEKWLALKDFSKLISILLNRKEVQKNDVRRVPQLLHDLKKYYPQQFTDFQRKLFLAQKDYIIQYLQQGISEGLVRENINIEMTAVLFAKFHSDTIRDLEMMEQSGYNMHTFTHIAKDVFIRGVLSQEGLKLYNER